MATVAISPVFLGFPIGVGNDSPRLLPSFSLSFDLSACCFQLPAFSSIPSLSFYSSDKISYSASIIFLKPSSIDR
jgi:hypothetical protein